MATCSLDLGAYHVPEDVDNLDTEDDELATDVRHANGQVVPIHFGLEEFQHQLNNTYGDWEPDFLQVNSEITIDSERTHYVQTPDLEEAADLLEERGRVVLCGGPGSGKTTLAHALLRQYRNKGYKTYVLAKVEDWFKYIGEGRRSVVLMDGTLGKVRVDGAEFKHWESITRSVQELNKTGECLLVLTLYPHILRELHVLSDGTDSPLLESMVVVRLMREALDQQVKRDMLTVHLQQLHLDLAQQDALVTEILQKDVSGTAFPWCCRQIVKVWFTSSDPTACFSASAEVHVPLIQRMLRDPEHGETMAAVMSLIMLGQGRFLRNPQRVQPQLLKLGFRDFSDYRLEEYADVLKGSILSEEGDRFDSRVIYDAVGLALGRSFSLPILLKVCDVTFLVQHVRTTETATPFSVTIGPSSESPDDRQLLMQTMYEHLVSGRLPELCQHPSLHCPQFLQELEAFCRAKKNYVQRVVSAVDTVHRLPLLYWSVSGRSQHLTHWWLRLMTKEEILGSIKGDELMRVALAYALARSIFDIKDNKMFMILKHAKTSKNAILLPKSQLAKTSRIASSKSAVDRIQSPRYLDDPSLPIPDTLVSMEVRISHDGDKVRVVVPSKQWYLALRLLADRQVDERDDEGNTLLHVAAEAGDVEAVKIAVRSGASVTATNNRGQTPPQLAANRRAKERNRTSNICSLSSPLFSACITGDEDKVKVLLCTSSSVQDKDDYGRTPLHRTCVSGQTDMAALLISLEADVNSKDARGYTPLHHAFKYGYAGTAEFLKQHHADVDVKSNWGNTLLHDVCMEGDTRTAELLIQHHADVNTKNDGGCTPLFIACVEGHTGTAELLIQHHADVNAKPRNGDTPLDWAIMRRNTDLARLLIQHGAVVKRKSKTHKELTSLGIQVPKINMT